MGRFVEELRTLSWFTDYVHPAAGMAHAAQMAASPYPIRWDINAALDSGVEALTDDDSAALAGGVRVPAVFVHGADDPRPWTSAALADVSPARPLHVLAGAGHLP